MPTKTTRKKAQKKARRGNSASTQAGEYVKAEIDQIRKGKHGARSAKQAIAIGLSEARRDGIKIKAKPGSKKSTTSSKKKKVSVKRSRAATKALRREPRSTVSKKALSKQARSTKKKSRSKNPSNTNSPSKARQDSRS